MFSFFAVKKGVPPDDKYAGHLVGLPSVLSYDSNKPKKKQKPSEKG